MRGAMVPLGLLSCLGLAGCAGGMAGPTSEPAGGAFPPAASSSGPPNMAFPFSAAAAPAPVAEAAPVKPAPKPRANRAARGATAPAAPAAAEPDHELSEQEKVLQARTDCWMGVERAKVGQDIDKRMAWVDKCIADKTKR